MRIGIYGGCFNPPHLGHLGLIEKLLSSKIVDKVIVVPTGDNYDKKGLASFKDRYTMLQIMFKNVQNVIVSNYENKKRLVYSYETLDYYQNIYKDDEIFFVCGVDNIMTIQSWQNYEYILNKYKVIVVNRLGVGYNLNILDRYNDSIHFVDFHLPLMSSTFIRENIANIDKINYILPHNVLQYIISNNLYNGSDNKCLVML